MLVPTHASCFHDYQAHLRFEGSFAQYMSYSGLFCHVLCSIMVSFSTIDWSRPTGTSHTENSYHDKGIVSCKHFKRSEREKVEVGFWKRTVRVEIADSWKKKRKIQGQEGTEGGHDAPFAHAQSCRHCRRKVLCSSAPWPSASMTGPLP